jgi:hypothetical protein
MRSWVPGIAACLVAWTVVAGCGSSFQDSGTDSGFEKGDGAEDAHSSNSGHDGAIADASHREAGNDGSESDASRRPDASESGDDGSARDASRRPDASETDRDGSISDAPESREGGSDASAPEGGHDAGVDATDEDSSVLGSPCSVPGALACAGNAQKVVLICSGDLWTLASICPSGQNCDSRSGSDQGACATVDPLCTGSNPGDYVCSNDTTVVACGPDLVSDSPVHTCMNQACVEGTCTGVCGPGTSQCSGNAVQTCGSNGQWSAAVACPLTAPFCAMGACTLL